MHLCKSLLNIFANAYILKILKLPNKETLIIVNNPLFLIANDPFLTVSILIIKVTVIDPEAGNKTPEVAAFGGRASQGQASVWMVHSRLAQHR